MLRRLKELVASLTYFEKWLILGAIIGIASGLFVVAFFYLLDLVARAAAWMIGYKGQMSSDYALLALGASKRWMLPITILLGAAISSILVYTFAPEAEGHGTDATIDVFHRRAGIMAPHVPVVKALASAATIGLGGSGGVEGPGVQMGGGIGSILAKHLHLGFGGRRIAVVSGMAGALAALFRSPMGSALFAIEVLYRRDFEVQALVPAMISSVISYAITGPLLGFKEILPPIRVSTEALYAPGSIVAYLLLGLFAAPFALFYAKSFYSLKLLFEYARMRLRYTVYLKPLIGGLMTGAMGLGIPHILGNGRGLLAVFLGSMGGGDPHSFLIFSAPFWISLLILAVAKILATGFSIASGGSGGVFAPGILSGALVGASFGMLIGARISPLDPTVYAYIGTAAFFGAAAKTPFASSVMVSEMGGNYFLIVPTFLAALVARELSGHPSIYASQLEHRLAPGMVSVEVLMDSVERARKYGMHRRITLGEVVDRRYKPISPDAPVMEAIDMMINQRQRVVPLVNDEGKVCGALDLSDLEMLIELGEVKPNTPSRLVRLRVSPIMREDESLGRAVEEMMAKDYDYVIVVDKEGRYLGIAVLEEIAAALAHLILKKSGR